MKSLLLLPEDFGEAQAFTVIDILRRAGADVTLCGLVSSSVTGAQNTKITADTKLENIDSNNYDLLILPGGPGYKNLINSAAAVKLIKTFAVQKKYIAAMCEAPLALAKAGAIENSIVTVYPGYEPQVPRPRNARVIVDGNIITCRSPSCAMDFALKLTEIAVNKKAAQKAKQEMYG